MRTTATALRQCAGEAAHGITELAQVTRNLAVASLDSSRNSSGQRRVEAPEKDVLPDGEGERLNDWIRIASDLFLLLPERGYNGITHAPTEHTHKPLQCTAFIKVVRLRATQ